MTVTGTPHFAARSGVNVAGERHAPLAPDDGSGTPTAPAVDGKPDGKTTDPVAAVLSLEQRIAARRDAADKAERERAFGRDSKGFDKADDAKDKPAAKDGDKPAEKPADKPDAEVERLKTEHAAAPPTIAQHEGRLAEWDDLAEETAAELDARAAKIKRYEALLARAGYKADPRDDEIQRLRQADAIRKMQDERTAAIVKQQEALEAQRIENERRAQVNAGYSAIITKYPDLTLATEQGKKFWTMIANRGPSGPDPLPPEVAIRIAERFTVPAGSTSAPRTLRQGAVGGGAQAKSSDPLDIADKWKARLRAG